MLDHGALMRLKLPATTIEWSDAETMLHALAIGMGREPDGARSLPYIYEPGLKALPTLLSVLEKRAAPARLRLMEIDLHQVLHLGQSIQVHTPVPSHGRLHSLPRITHAFAKGETSAIVFEENVLIDERSQEPVATSLSTMMIRNVTNFGGGGARPAPIWTAPARAPDALVRKQVRPEQAGLFRLLGDRNPLHIDPEAARAAGFPLPILHGMCTLGMAQVGLLDGFDDLTSDEIASFGANFAAPVFPGDTLRMSFWRDAKSILFVVDVEGREQIVLRGGLATLH